MQGLALWDTGATEELGEGDALVSGGGAVVLFGSGFGEGQGFDFGKIQVEPCFDLAVDCQASLSGAEYRRGK